jgi:hypothetical protein
MTTIEDIYAAINPLPAKLSEKGKVKPNVEFEIEANAGVRIAMSWKKYGAVSDWEKEYQHFFGGSFDECIRKAEAFISALPTAEQARLHAFMDKLGKLIDVGKTEGIAVDYLNPLLDSMKRLSENAIAYKPEPEPIPF